MAKEKSRFSRFVIPRREGFPTDWEDRLERIGVPIAISPLHDKDKAKGGGYKKGIITGFILRRIQSLVNPSEIN